MPRALFKVSEARRRASALTSDWPCKTTSCVMVYLASSALVCWLCLRNVPRSVPVLDSYNELGPFVANRHVAMLMVTQGDGPLDLALSAKFRRAGLRLEQIHGDAVLAHADTRRDRQFGRLFPLEDKGPTIFVCIDGEFTMEPGITAQSKVVDIVETFQSRVQEWRQASGTPEDADVARIDGSCGSLVSRTYKYILMITGLLVTASILTTFLYLRSPPAPGDVLVQDEHKIEMQSGILA